MDKKLYRSSSDKMICGVCGGLGEFFQIDTTVIRLIWAIASFFGPGVIIYIIAAVTIPKEIY